MALTFEETSRTVHTGPWTIHYTEAGDPSAPAVVLLHGSGPGATGWSNFKTNLEALARALPRHRPGHARLGHGPTR